MLYSSKLVKNGILKTLFCLEDKNKRKEILL